MSEIRGLDWKNVDLENGLIFVQGARGFEAWTGMLTGKQNKNRDSSRYIPVMIPRLSEVLTAVPNKTGKVCSIGSNTLLDDVKRCCKMAGVTICTVHDLRKVICQPVLFTFRFRPGRFKNGAAWKDDVVLNKIYIKLSNTMKTESKPNSPSSLPMENSSLAFFHWQIESSKADI